MKTYVAENLQSYAAGNLQSHPSTRYGVYTVCPVALPFIFLNVFARIFGTFIFFCRYLPRNIQCVVKALSCKGQVFISYL